MRGSVVFLSKKLAAVFILLSLAGCGYSVRGSASLPFQSVRIADIENRTTQPDIQDIFYTKLADEFIRQGIRINSSSEYVLSGTIKSFTLNILSEKDQFSNEYEVSVVSDFVVTGPDGFRREYLSKKSPFIESFIARTDLNSVITQKDIATERAIEDLAKAVVLEIIYREP